MIDVRVFLVGILFLFAVRGTSQETCKNMFDNIEHSLQSGSGGYQIFIRDEEGKMALSLLPEHKYRIKISNSMLNIPISNFQVQTSYDGTRNNSVESFGKFLLSKKVKTVTGCFGSVMGHDNKIREIDLLWQAPKYPKGCVNFRSFVVMSPNLVYYDSYKLETKLCPELLFEKVNNNQVLINGIQPSFKECCACGTASYKVEFKGLWNKMTHPKDWPETSGHLHWTNPIGVTHNYDYMIYNLGRKASLPVRSLCSAGDSSELKREILSDTVRDNVRSLFNSAGMYGEDQLNENRIGYISVTKTHHLFSFLSMMGPSTDWCSGISSLDLCTNACSWKQNISIPLFPMDFGFKSGETYYPNITENLDVPDPIREINKKWMKGSPFTDNTPVAQVTLTRVQPKEDWECTGKSIPGVLEVQNMTNDGISNRGNKRKTPLDDPTLAQMATFLCKLSEWSEWTPCSASCGQGQRTRTRKLLLNNKNELCRHLDLSETQTCEGRKDMCDLFKCSLQQWTSWSLCTATCDKPGKIIRTRAFAREKNKDECTKESKNPIQFVQEKICHLSSSDRRCDPLAICSDGKDEGNKCTQRSRNRFFYNMKTLKCESFKYFGCKGSLNNFISVEHCNNTCAKTINDLPQWRKDQLTLLQTKATFTEGSQKPVKLPDLCLSTIDYGYTCSARTQSVEWYFDLRVQRCRSFTYLGCDGNDNRFSSYSRCMEICMPQIKEDSATKYKVDCTVSEWGHWGPCSAMCGEGEHIRWRNIIHSEVNGGVPCPSLYETGKCFIKKC